MTEFHFKTKLDQSLLLGLKARTVEELLEHLLHVPDASIYFHTHKFLHQHHYLSPEPPNDFAYWMTEVLNDAELGESLSSVDIIQYNTLADLRTRFVEILEGHVKTAQSRRHAPRGEEFYFMASRMFVFGTSHVAHSLTEFVDIVQQVSVNSLYFHVFDARLRLQQGENDFSRWFSDLGKTELAKQIAQLDPYTQTLEGLRRRIIRLVQKYDTH